MKRWRAENRQRIKEYMLRWRADNHVKIRRSDNAWRKSRGEPLKRRKQTYDRKHAARINTNRRRRYHLVNKLRPKTPQQRLTESLRARLRQALKRRKAGVRTRAMLGCSMNDFMLYLESRFKPRMSWLNYGSSWEMDHMMPCAMFDLTKPEHKKACFHFSNIQPMFVRQNRSKSGKIITDQFNLL